MPRYAPAIAALVVALFLLSVPISPGAGRARLLPLDGLPTATPSASMTMTASATATASPSATATASPTLTPTATATLTPTATQTQTPAATATATATPPPSATPTRTPTRATPTRTPRPRATPTRTATPRPTATPRAQITLAAAVINPGDTITLHGSGFAARETVYVGIDGAIFADTQSDASGALPSIGFAVPITLSAGRHTVFARGSSSNRRAQATVSVNYVNPTLTLDRSSVSVGTPLCARGAGYVPGELVSLAVDGVAVTAVRASSGGSFSACFGTPANIVSGSNTLSAVGSSGRTAYSTRFSGALPVASTFYFAGASTAGGDDTDVPILNPSALPALVTMTVFLPKSGPLLHTFSVAAFTRSTLVLSEYAPNVRGFGLEIQADRVVGAEMVVRRGINNPFATAGARALSRRWYLAEGYTGQTFHEWLYVLNPGRTAAKIRVRVLPAKGGGARVASYIIPATSPYTIDVNGVLPRAGLSAVVDATVPVLVVRAMTFGKGGYGAAADVGVPAPAPDWLFAAGSTANKYQTFITVLNPGAVATKVMVQVYDAAGRLLGSRRAVVGSESRVSLRLNDLARKSAIVTRVRSSAPVVVERAMYDGDPNQAHTGGSIVSGANATALTWTFPDGDTALGSREHLLVFNPNRTTLRLHAIFYASDGRVAGADFAVHSGARLTIDVVAAMHGVADTMHGSQLTSSNRLGFTAEQTISDDSLGAGYSVMGLPG